MASQIEEHFSQVNAYRWGRLAAIIGGYPSGFRGAGCARVKQDPEGVGSNPTSPI